MPRTKRRQERNKGSLRARRSTNTENSSTEMFVPRRLDRLSATRSSNARFPRQAQRTSKSTTRGRRPAVRADVYLSFSFFSCQSASDNAERPSCSFLHSRLACTNAHPCEMIRLSGRFSRFSGECAHGSPRSRPKRSGIREYFYSRGRSLPTVIPIRSRRYGANKTARTNSIGGSIPLFSPRRWRSASSFSSSRGGRAVCLPSALHWGDSGIATDW